MNKKTHLLPLMLVSLFVVTSVVFQFCSHATGNRKVHPEPGLYLRSDTSLDGQIVNRVLLFGKRNAVRFISYYLHPRHKLLHNMNEFCPKMKYEVRGDSITFHADSIFIGFRTMEYTAFGVHHLDSFPQYSQGLTMDFRGKIYGDTIRIKSFEVSTQISIYKRTQEDVYLLQRSPK